MRTLVSAALAGLLLSAGAVAPAPAAGAAVPAPVTGSAVPAALVDAVPTPELDWQPCHDIAECATVRLPLDYDEPDGETIGIGVLRVRAKDRAHRIGSLFVNPGGPGGSATEMALSAPSFLSGSLLRRFDIVGVDPRGIGAGEHLTCFTSAGEQAGVLDLFSAAFPVTRKENADYVRGSELLGRACSTTGRRLAGSVSTAEVARDMDVIRRAVGDSKLTFYGKSYGSYLGQVYANMFPDRFRALVVDGTIDPVAWTGRNTRQILDDRVHFSDGAYRALVDLLRRCDRAGEERCVFAAGDPVRNFDAITRRLLLGRGPMTYADFVMATILALFSPDAGAQVTRLAADVRAALDGGRVSPRAAVAYDNTKEAGTAVLCTDGLFPGDAATWPAAVAGDQLPGGRWRRAGCSRTRRC
ncbi:alpha/beta fold hydrolase [Winogradskya humida]|uniref:AB hydrolase-1 domain-containing protein n=1 Tax=Winogradskya humida TaxID=113566 RepID=A0ABQ4A032_9ACTN|nr:alpha/beta fold hydrolase [Actinoplanes humidus]GIE24196.1 hypothetical protein Ahu01nite_072980 [Actinoplanes humidus]